MAAVTRNDLNAGVLQTYLNRKTLENLRSELYFYQLGQKPTAPSGYNTVSWARFTKLAATDVTTGTTSNDGVTPADTAFNASVVTATPTQYRVVVTLSDVVIENNVIDFLKGAAVEVGNAMAEKIDNVIQGEIMAGDNKFYGGDASSRPTLESGDNMTHTLIAKAVTLLRSKSAKTFGGFYACAVHPFQAYDLRASTATGSWLDSNKYTTPDKLFKGEIGALAGARVMEMPNIQTFSSNVTVYPALVFGQGAYGVSDFQKMRVYFTPATPSDSDPLAQRRKVGSKVMFATKRLQEDAMVRIETSATNIASA